MYKLSAYDWDPIYGYQTPGNIVRTIRLKNQDINTPYHKHFLTKQNAKNSKTIAVITPKAIKTHWGIPVFRASTVISLYAILLNSGWKDRQLEQNPERVRIDQRCLYPTLSKFHFVLFTFHAAIGILFGLRVHFKFSFRNHDVDYHQEEKEKRTNQVQMKDISVIECQDDSMWQLLILHCRFEYGGWGRSEKDEKM